MVFKSLTVPSGVRSKAWEQHTYSRRSEASVLGRVFWPRIIERDFEDLLVSSREESGNCFTVINVINRPIPGVGRGRSRTQGKLAE